MPNILLEGEKDKKNEKERKRNKRKSGRNWKRKRSTLSKSECFLFIIKNLHNTTFSLFLSFVVSLLVDFSSFSVTQTDPSYIIFAETEVTIFFHNRKREKKKKEKEEAEREREDVRIR